MNNNIRIWCSWIVTISMLMVGSLSYAAPPVPKSCDSTTYPDKGDRLKCLFDNVAEQQTAAADMVANMPGIPDRQKNALKNTAMRGKKVQDRAKGNDYKQLTKKSEFQCQIAEVKEEILHKGDNDGVCTSGEDCAEKLNDGIGNEDGFCSPMKGKKREVCVQFCDTDGINNNPDNFDNTATDSISDDLEAQLADTTVQYAELNTELGTMMVASAAIQAAASSGNCNEVFQTRPDVTNGLIASQAAVTLRGVAGQFSTVCDLTVGGFNIRYACIVTETLASIAELIDDSIEYQTADIDSNTMDATYACLQDVNVSVGQSNNDLDEIKKKLRNVNKRLKVMQQQLDLVNQNLLTPQGQRAGFNK